MGCGEFLVKYILFFANLFFALSGLALLGIGVAVQLKISIVTDIIDGFYEFGPIASMVVGSVVFLIAFLGCCGAIRESNCMLVTYSIFMIVLMILKVALGTVVFVNADSLVSSVKAEFNRTFVDHLDNFHKIETSLRCCGPDGPISYGMNVFTLPPSCCDEGVTLCQPLSAHPGCNSRAEDFITTFATAIGVVCIVVAALELVAVVFGLCLANHVRNRDRRTRY
ncbi:23 kDa integral membrane protein-like [Choristoneura fumiferana]|uniref:23 kDa integral membrane protein-like n=1 Tax=Choristoneura fumiferana TaxID=7141 RepID=UPI003D15505D